MRIPFDLSAARGREVDAADDADVLGEILAGTRNVERVEIGDVVLVVRATTFEEQRQAEDAARSAAAAFGASSIVDDIAPRHLLARAVLERNALLNGERVPLFDVAALGQLPRRLVEQLARAHGIARQRAYPPLEDRELDAMMKRLRLHAAESPDRLRARHSTPAEIFGLPLIELTSWQLAYFAALNR